MAAEAAGGDPRFVKEVHFKALSLNELRVGPLVDLSVAQQRRQMSRPFERFNTHWLISIEKLLPSNVEGGGFDILVMLFNLSVPTNTPGGFPIKGRIDIDPAMSSDGQARVYNPRRSVVCDVVGEQSPADFILMKNIRLSLESGQTQSETIVTMCTEDGVDLLHGYYDENWRGAGAILLENHLFHHSRDGDGITINVEFLDEPIPARRMGA
mmetsp:Transcript_13120/g.28479  ORF Transcript_13120/g.28479 Transcript_13120/m.28479 type:complete len:211 (+) Transcript_13120:60-692(+)